MKSECALSQDPHTVQRAELSFCKRPPGFTQVHRLAVAPQPFASREVQPPGKGMNVDRMGASHSSTDCISWRNFWRVKGFLLGRGGTGLSISASYKQVSLILQETQVKCIHGEDSWISPGSGVKDMQMLRSRTSQCYQQLQKILILFQLSSVRADMTSQDYSILSTCLWSKFFVSCYSSAPQAFKHRTPFTSCLNYMHPHHKTEWLKVCPHRSWPRQLLIRMWRIQPHPENGRGHKVGQTGWHWQACESEHKGEMKILLTARWAWRQQGA